MLLSLPPAVDVATLEKLRVAPPSGFDVYEDVIVDTVIYPAAGVSRLDFFSQTTQDRTLCNVQPAGQLPQGQYFRAHRLFLDFLTEPSKSDGAATIGRLADVDKILNTARGVISFSTNAKQRTRNPIPLRSLGGMGGAAGTIAGGAVAEFQHVRNAPNGGFPFDVIIRGGETFRFGVDFRPDTLTAISADLPIALLVYGWRYVPV